ncbi:hypothetical protein OEG92_17705 [Polaribacter sejongensis]
MTSKDVEKVISIYHQQGVVNKEQQIFITKSILSIVNHPELELYFSDKVKVFNEREIVDVDNQIIILDRLIFIADKKVVIIDYKTGNPSSEHHQQLLRYERTLKLMNFIIEKKLLIYINEEIDVVEV